MNLKVRLYWQHDLDLIALAKHPDFDIAHWMKRAVIAYARGDAGFYIPLPRPQPYRVELDSCDVNFALSLDKEEDVIISMLGFRYGFRNHALKIIFRSFMERPALDVFFNEEMFATKARGKKRGATSLSELASLPKTISPAPLTRTSASYHNNNVVEKPQTPVNFANDTSAVPQKEASAPPVSKTPEPEVTYHSPEPSVSKEPSKLENNWETELDLSQEESEDMQGEVFDLFGAVRKLM